MACNWLMMTSSGDDNRPSGSLDLLTDKKKQAKCLPYFRKVQMNVFTRWKNLSECTTTSDSEVTKQAVCLEGVVM